MSCLVWNCQGLGGSWTVRTLGEHIHETNPHLIFLTETKLTERKIEDLKAKFNLFGVSVDARGRSGGIALLWKKTVTVLLQSFSIYHIDVHVYNNNDPDGWRFTGFYGDPDPYKRKGSFELLRNLATVSSKPWVCAGDFNAITSHGEQEGGRIKPVWQLRDFQNCLRDSGLMDLGFTGFKYTWCNRRNYPNTTWERLDRACATIEWCQKFPSHKVTHRQTRNSDHLPIHIEFATSVNIMGNMVKEKRFKFEAMWLRSADCEKVIRDSWNVEHIDQGTTIWSKIDNCRLGLLNWSRTTFGSVKSQIRKMKKEIHDLRSNQITATSKAKELELNRELEALLDKENLMWEQRAKAHWLIDGDRNTNFFHARASARKERNEIRAIRNGEGNWCESRMEIENTVINYFQALFRSAKPSENEINSALEAVRVKVDQRANQELLRPYSTNEVHQAIRNMHPLKSPGPDGLSALFYQKYWNLIGHDISTCVLNFLNNRSFNNKCNYTHIVLIPKVQTPESMTQFRPISLCNVIYKIASKAIVNRLKPLMNTIISEHQSAFVPTRQITDNVLVAYEITQFMRQKIKGKEGHMAIKLDMCKAYDKVEWNFIRGVMNRLGFNVSFIDLIMMCVSTVSYSCVLNGDQIGYIIPERGIRQGDPLSPFLFLFCAEALSSLISREEEHGNIKGIRICNGAPSVSHLLFADDTLILCGANPGEAACIKRILDVYGKASGQDINLQKSSIVFSRNVGAEKIGSIQEVLPIRVEERHEKYLGLPLTVGKSRKEVFNFIRERFWNKIQGWNEKLLSKAGKEVLIKAVIQAIPSYVMNCFKLPKSLINDLESMISGFWWNDKGAKKLHWINWATLCSSKRIGGLGFRDLEAFNLALLAKQAWRIIHKPENLLSRILKARYFPDCDFIQSELGSRPSLTWRSIWASKSLLEAGIRWRVGNGNSIDIWRDAWLPQPHRFRILSPRVPQLHDAKVSALIDPNLGQWNRGLLDTYFWAIDVERIISIPLGSQQNQDKLIWHYTNNGIFTVRSAYHLAMDLKNDRASGSEGARDWRWIWKTNVAPKLKLFLWRACMNALPTRISLARRHIQIPELECPLCHAENEDVMHCLLRCSFARQFWALSEFSFSTYHTESHSAIEWIEEVRKKTDQGEFALFITSCWCIWWNRNQVVWGKKEKEPLESVHFAKNYHQIYASATRRPSSDTIFPQSSRQTTAHWVKPPNGIIKINFDGAFKGAENVAGIGCIARDSNGECVDWIAERRTHVTSAVIAEALAAKRAMDMGIRLGALDVILEGDCKNLIDSIEDHSPSLHDYGPLVDDIKRLASSLDSFRANHVYRESNKVAHFLAFSANRLGLGASIAPAELLNLVANDIA